MKTNARDMQHKEDNKRVRRYGHREHTDQHDHTRRHKKHRRHAKEDDCDIHHDSKNHRKLEELVHGLTKDDEPPPLLPSSRDSDVAVEWTSLPRDVVVFCILDKLLEPIDHVRFAIVSKEWGLVAKNYNHTTQRWSKQQQPLPMLMIATGTKDEHKLYSVTETRIYDHIRLPAVPYNGKSYGSNYGWLAVIDRSLEEIWISDLERSPYGHEVVVTTYRIALQNPFRKGIEAIHLPPLKYSFLKAEEHYTYIVPNVLFSEDPYLHPENYVVLAFCNHYLPLALFKRGQKDWVHFESPCVRDNTMYSSAIFYRNQIYAIDDFAAEMMIADVYYSTARTSPPERHLHFADRRNCTPGRSYLVESTRRDLWCVRKLYEKKKDGGRGWFPTFRVYKIEEDEFSFDMLEMENIGDEAIFVANSHSICVSASKFPGCQPNSIYYTTDDSRKLFATCPKEDGRKCEMGVFNLDHKVMTTLYSSEDERYWNNYIPHWVLPHLSTDSSSSS